MLTRVSSNPATDAYSSDFVTQARSLAEQEPKEIITSGLINSLWRQRDGHPSEILEEQGYSSSTPKKAVDILNEHAIPLDLARFIEPNEISPCNDKDVDELIKNPPTKTKIGIAESYTKIEWLLAIFNLAPSRDGQVRAGDLVRDPKIFNRLLGIINKYSFPEALLTKAATPVKAFVIVKAAPVASTSPSTTQPQREIIRNGVPVELAKPVINIATPKVVTPIVAAPKPPKPPIESVTETSTERNPLEAIETCLRNFDQKQTINSRRESLKPLLAEVCKYIGISPQTQASKNTKINFKLFFDLIRGEAISDTDKNPYECPEDVVQLLHIVFSAQNKGGTTTIIPRRLREQGNLLKFLNGLKSFVKERFSTGL